MARDIAKIVSEMTLEEKASLLGGADFWHTKAVERLGIPAAMVSDGPHGLRKQNEKADHLGVNESIVAVCFPAGCATASSFDRDLERELGETIGNECQAEDLAVVLGPAVNIKRSPLCGRNFEYFSEDPVVAGKMSAAYINGVQSKGVGTSIKHFALNNQETRRMSISSEVSDRTIREIYFPAFETAVKEAQPWTVMCSYNKINGSFSSDNEWLLTKVLRDDWGFQGAVVTDWGAVDDRVQGVRAGLDLEMPGNTATNDARIVEAVKKGDLSEEQVDVCVSRMLKLIYDYADHHDETAVFDRAADHEKAVDFAGRCAVLLQNDGTLPLAADAKVAYIGGFAKKPRFQGGGSSHINSFKIESALESAEKKGRNVTYTEGFLPDDTEVDQAKIEAAVSAAKAADVAVIFAGLPDSIESEGYDRDDMKLPACQNALIEAVAAVQKKTVVVLHNGSPVECPWADDVAAVLEMYLSGEGTGEATDRLLFGEVNPSGHLAETFPMKLSDNPSFLNFPGDLKTVKYAEGVFVGYRYYEKKEMPVRWAFGHGLSYTTFEMKNLRTSADSMKDDSTLTVTVDVTNTGKVAGAQVVQLYVADRNGTPERPVKELKDFGKVFLAPGETKSVEMKLTARDLSYFEEKLDDWFAPSGKYELLVGDASDHIILKKEIAFTTEKVLPLHVSGDTITEELLANPKTAPIMKELIAKVSAALGVGTEEGTAAAEAITAKMNQAMMLYMPLKSLPSFGAMTPDQLDALIAKMNEAVSS
ncbi:MAG: glycoside hydrolase family 3 C-terminal domain-containing protein [Lachnospiraceae bacterium]|nr:glycoside hydrolase family 3 C-terminal domain-containing protein [Lachnospiraceae bacterium]